jgi:zinc transport system ATP-binding protein
MHKYNIVSDRGDERMVNESRFHNNKECSDNCCGFCCTKIENFGVTFGKTKILENVNLHIHCGELTAVIGPNGAGKSTLLKSILGDVGHTGTLYFLDAKGRRTGRPLIGYVPQSLNLDNSSPTSVLDLFMSCRTWFPTWFHTPKKVVSDIVENLSKVKAEYLINRRLGELSGGEMQRVLLALALAPVPDLLLLDEPMSGIDQNGLELFYQTLSDLRNSYDLSIILVSHDLELVEKYADRVILLNRTILANGIPSDVLSCQDFYDVFAMKWKRENTKSNCIDGGKT